MRVSLCDLEVFQIDCFVFAGDKVALLAELPTAEIDSIRVAEAQRLLDLTDALYLGEETLESWLGGTPNILPVCPPKLID